MPKRIREPDLERSESYKSEQSTSALAQDYISASKWDCSIVKIFSTSSIPDFENPWVGNEIEKCTGSGFIFSKDDENYIITNAHVVDGSVSLKVRFSHSRIKFSASLHQIGRHCDLALLKVDSSDFTSLAKPMQFGGMVHTFQPVTVIGFPMGGDGISATFGKISRILVDTYEHSGLELLQAQTDAAINSGNSGGPVLSDELVVGVAFQGVSFAQNLGYLIPMPVVSSFVRDAIPRLYRGFPDLGFQYQNLENKVLRDHLGLSRSESGIRILRIDPLSESAKVLKEGDVLLKIDDVVIHNDGTCDREYGDGLNFVTYLHEKPMGSSVKLTFKRDGVEQQQSVKLNSNFDDTKLVTCSGENQPTFFISSGIVFQEVTEEYIQSRSGSFLESDCDQWGSLSNVPKKSPDQSKVIINRVLDYEGTEGYTEYDNETVVKINGEEINNIRDLMRIIESSKEPNIIVELKSAEVLAVKKLSKAEHDEVLSNYLINADRSNNLKQSRVTMFSEAALDTVSTKKNKKNKKKKFKANRQPVATDISSTGKTVLGI